MSQLRTHLNLLDDDSGDYGIEIDPREADWSTMGLLRELGFNRVSLGVQDFDMEVQKAVNRMQTPEETRTIVEAARTLQYRSINLDLIYGLPKQTPDSFARTVDEVIALQPDRLSVFNYAHLPERFMPQRRINADDLPSPPEAGNAPAHHRATRRGGLPLYRHGSLRPARRRAGQRPGRRHPATQFPGLHHARAL